MYYFPNFDNKLNYQLYLLIYGERKAHWYDDIIPKIHQFIQALHNELKDYKCPFLLITLAGIITFVLCGIIIKILGNLYRSSPDQYHNLENLQLAEVRSSESIELNEEFISNSDIVSERSDPVIKQEINEILESFQAIEVCQEEPCTKECIFEGYKKVFVLTISMNDLPTNIVEKLNILNDPDCTKCHPIDEVQPLILEIIDKVLAQVTDKCNHCIDNISNKSQTITSIIPQNGDNQDTIINKCLENSCRGQKTQSGSKIPLSRKCRQQRQFIKNINDP